MLGEKNCSQPSSHPNQIEGDVKDTVYPARIAFKGSMRFRFFDRNDRRLKDMIYQIAGITYTVIRDPRSGRG